MVSVKQVMEYVDENWDEIKEKAICVAKELGEVDKHDTDFIMTISLEHGLKGHVMLEFDEWDEDTCGTYTSSCIIPIDLVASDEWVQEIERREREAHEAKLKKIAEKAEHDKIQRRLQYEKLKEEFEKK